jgi:hypothetical protein
LGKQISRPVLLAASVLILPGLRAQSPEMQQRIAELQDSMVVSKKLTISIRNFNYQHM